MIEIIKNCVAKSLRGLGLDVRRITSTPFGVRWHQDIRFFANGARLPIVLDVGANTGQTALVVSRHFPESRIYSFEPVPTTFEELVNNTRRHGRIEPICCALGADTGSAKMTTDPLSASNTIMVDAQSTLNAKPLAEVKVDTVSSFCAARGIQRVNLLKIDTEGYETQVLSGAEKLLAEKRIDFVVVECDFFRRSGEPHGDFTEIWRYLSAFGFHIVAFYAGGVDDLGWVWGDVLFRECSKEKSGRVACSPADGHG